MSESWSSIVLERSEDGIGIGLVSRAVQETTAIITADIVAVRGNSTAAVENICARSSRIQDTVSDLKCPAVPNGPSIVCGVSAESAIGYQQRFTTEVNNTAADSWLATAPACRVAAQGTVGDRHIAAVNNAAPTSHALNLRSERPVIANSTVKDRQRATVLDEAASLSPGLRVASGIVAYGAVDDRDCPKGIPDGTRRWTAEIVVDGTVSDHHRAVIVVDATSVALDAWRKERGIVKGYKRVADSEHCAAIRAPIEYRAAEPSSGKVILQSRITDGQRSVALLAIAKNASTTVPGVVGQSAIINGRITMIIEDPAAVRVAVTDGDTSYRDVMAGHYVEDSERIV